MTRIALAAVAATLILAAAPAIAGEAWEVKTANAHFSVYSHYCSPGFYEKAAAPDAPPSSMEIAIYSEALRTDYANDCGAYYVAQIAPRLNPSQVALR
jgi:hypothetical protein